MCGLSAAAWVATDAAAQPGATSPASERAAASPDAIEEEASQPSLGEALERLAKLQFDLERALASTRLDLASSQRRFEAAQQRLDTDPDPSDGLREEVAARRLELEAEQRLEALLAGRIERRADEEQIWRRLHALERTRVAPEELAEWASDAEEVSGALAREAAVKAARLDEVRRDLAFTRTQLEQTPSGSPLARWLRVRVRALENLERGYGEDIESIEAVRALEDTLSSRLASARRDLPLAARLRGALHQLREVWTYQLTGSEPEPITIGKIVGALAIFLVGWMLARLLSRLLGTRVFPGLRMEEGAAAAFESLAFYLLMLVAFLTALRMVQIPLTAFAVVGGALAIGVGFGSQNIVNNFISGIILLAERPIKRNDLVEVQGVIGNVEQIGLRSTRVRTGDNVHIIVPNAVFLESNVVNWTHSDERVRIRISVGVAYGSPTRDVERLIAEAVRSHPAILRSPEPLVLFMEFGDNALIFETRFWIEMRTVMARLKIESEVRFEIDRLFREAGITIAFPQRDVHLDSVAPVEVRLVSEGRGEASEEQG